MVPLARAQNGHWKSENSTIVIGASAVPRAGAPARSSATGFGGLDAARSLSCAPAAAAPSARQSARATTTLACTGRLPMLRRSVRSGAMRFSCPCPCRRPIARLEPFVDDERAGAGGQHLQGLQELDERVLRIGCQFLKPTPLRQRFAVMRQHGLA